MYLCMLVYIASQSLRHRKHVRIYVCTACSCMCVCVGVFVGMYICRSVTSGSFSVTLCMCMHK